MGGQLNLARDEPFSAGRRRRVHELRRGFLLGGGSPLVAATCAGEDGHSPSYS